MERQEMYGVFDAGMDGRAPSELQAVYYTEQEAKQRCGSYRHVSRVWVVEPTPDGRWFLLAQQAPILVGVDFDEQRRIARDAALKKLTPEERAALGLP